MATTISISVKFLESSAGAFGAEYVFDAADDGFFTFCDFDFDDIEAPWDLAGTEAAQPFVGAALDECLFLAIDGGEAADDCIFFAGFDLGKKELSALAGDDIDFAAFAAFEVFCENLASLGAEPVGGDFFAVISGPFARAASSRFRVVG